MGAFTKFCRESSNRTKITGIGHEYPSTFMNTLVINLTMVALYQGCKYCTAYVLAVGTVVQWLVWLPTLLLIFWLPYIPQLPKLQMFLLLSLLPFLPRLPLAGGAILTRARCRLFLACLIRAGYPVFLRFGIEPHSALLRCLTHVQITKSEM
jgi:hypothetical protein